MPLLDITKNETIRFLTENYYKTDLLRYNWIKRHKETLARAATLTREETGYRDIDITSATMKAGLMSIKRDHVSNAVNRKKVFYCDSDSILGISELKKGHSIADVGLGDPKLDPRLVRPDTDLQIDPKMRPVDPEHKDILSEGLPFFGRKIYLNKRKRIAPEDKYYFPESSGWDYGWRLRDSFFGKPTGPKFGHVVRF